MTASLSTLTPTSDRTFGIELEILVRDAGALAQALTAAGIRVTRESYNHVTRATWKLVHDVSVQAETSGTQGIELVSPPLSGADGIAAIRTVCRVLAEQKVKVNTTCGFHVHHDVRALDLRQLKNVVKRYLNHEGVIDQFMPASRRADTNRYCRSNRMRFYLDLPAIFQRLDEAKSIEEMIGTFQGTRPAHDRYYKLNLMAYSRQGTLEFRQHSGTIEADKIIAWVLFGQGMIDFAMTMQSSYAQVRKADDFTGLWKGIAPAHRDSLKSFYAARIADHETRLSTLRARLG